MHMGKLVKRIDVWRPGRPTAFGTRVGVLNNASMVAKHGILGLGMNLRQELALDRARGAQVCTVMPAMIDTPLPAPAGNCTGRRLKSSGLYTRLSRSP
jgi:NAD(P)-dependent dehydrogenase (short-subunit alcohol dehydrogenase family)